MMLIAMRIDKASQWLLALCLTACVTAGTGCGEPDMPRLVAVQGKVFKDGRGITAGSLYFHPGPDAAYQKDTPSSMLRTDGGFTIKTFPFGEGVSPGSYRVTLSPELASRLSCPEYADSATTPWLVVVPDEGLADLILNIDAD